MEIMKTDNGITIHTYVPGEPSLVCHFYYKLYAEQYHFNGTVEGYFIRGMAELFDSPGDSQLWVAKKNGSIVGCIAIIKKTHGKHSFAGLALICPYRERESETASWKQPCVSVKSETIRM